MIKVLLVDDEALMLETLENHVDWEELGFEVVGTAKNGEKALGLVHEKDPDIVITDIRMPTMDGIELSRVLRDIKPDIKIIFLTGYEEFSYAKEGLQLGITDYVLKPIYLQDFNALMKKIHHECLVEKRNTREFIELTKKQFLPFFKERGLYNDIIIEGNNEFLKQVDIFFGLAESVKIDLQVIKKVISDILAKAYNADKMFSGIPLTLQEIQEAIESFDTVDGVRSYCHIVVNKLEAFYKDLLDEPNHQVVNQMKAFIEQNYNTQLSIEDVGNSVHFSSGYARNLFKEIEGVTITEYIKSVRMDMAKELLKEKKYKVYDVAKKVGYDNISYFCSVFKDYTGLTPNDYKKMF